MRLFIILVSVFFINSFMTGCSETTTGTEEIISSDTIRVGHDEKLVGTWIPVKSITDGVTTTLLSGENSKLWIHSDFSYTDHSTLYEEIGVWETFGDSLTFKGTKNVLRTREGIYTVTANQFTFKLGKTLWYYNKE